MARNGAQKAIPKKAYAITAIAIAIVFAVALSVFLYSCTLPKSANGDKASVSVLNGEGDDAKDGKFTDMFRPKQVTELIDKTKKNNVYTILMTGVDNDKTRTDIIMLGVFDIDNGTLDILQIPRDTYVESKYKYKKINTLYSYGEEEELRNGIARTFGIEVDRYMTVDVKGFRAIVDLIGGVEIYVDSNMKYSDPTQDLKINLKKGLQVLNGDKSEQYVRYRKGYADGDLGRIDAQKKFLTAFLKQALKFSNVTKIPGMIKIGMESMKTDMTLDELGYFSFAALKLKSENISLYTAPGEPYLSNKDGVSYFTLYKKETLEMINAHLNPYEDEVTEVDIAELAHKYDYVYTDYKGTSIADIDEKNIRD